MTKTAARGRGGMAYAADLRKTGKLECSPGKPAMQNCSNSGKPQMAIPSQARRDTPAGKV